MPISFLSRNGARLPARLRTEMGCPKTRYLFSPDVRFPGQVKGDDQWRRIPCLKARERWTRPHRMDYVLCPIATSSPNSLIRTTLLQAYRQQFLVAETFTAAVAATTVFSNPTIALALAFLGIVILVGWILVTRSRARVLYSWDRKLRLLGAYREVFDRRDLEPSATMWARFWLGGDPIGVFQLAFGVFWAFLIFFAL